MMKNFFATLIIAVSFLLPVSAGAHGDKPSFEFEVGTYMIDIGYDQIGIRPGEEVRFDFDLYNQSGALAFAPFTHIDVAISKDGTEPFNTVIENRPNYIPGLAYTFTEAGEYTMSVQYRDNDTAIVEKAFPVPVGENNGYVGRAMAIGTYVLAGLLVIFALYIMITSFRAKR